MVDEPKLDSKTTEEAVTLLDLSEVEALIDLLVRKRAASFQGFGMTIVFKDDDEYQQFTKNPTKPQAQVVPDDGHSTSNKPVDGFRKLDGFRHKSLYPFQNGKVLKFDGSLE